MLQKKTLNANQLKLIAILAMTVDHLTWTLAPGYSTEWWVLLCHIIGRLTAPIMWFFIVEGWHYTHDIRKYTLRLFVLAFVSHFAYNFCFGIPLLPFQNGSFFNQTGVVWSLAWGLVLLRIHSNGKIASWLKFVLTMLICVVSFPSDWSCVASMAILYMGMARGNFKKQMICLMAWSGIYALVYFIFLDKLYAIIQLGTCLTIPLLRLYNGERGRWKGMGKVFYVYYPLHLALCGLLRVALRG